MNSVLFLKEMKRNVRKSAIWIGTITSFIILMAFIMPEMQGFMGGFMENIPGAMKTMFSMDEQSWSNNIGMYTTYFEFYILIGGGMFAAILGSSIIAKEEGDKTADFLMTKPMTRMQLITTKVIVFLAYIIIMNLIFYVVTALMFTITLDEFDYGKFTIISFYALLYTITIGFVGMLISVFIKRGRSISGAMIGIVFGFYVLKMISGVTPKMTNLSYLSLNKFVDLKVNSPGFALQAGNVMYYLLISALLVAVIYLKYRKKDIFN